MTDEAKDYIINIRVSRATYEKIKQKARENRDTISNLIRKTIDDSSEIISDLSRDLFGKKKPFADIASYHRARLAREQECAGCKVGLAIGEIVTVGQTPGGKSYYFCQACR